MTSFSTGCSSHSEAAVFPWDLLYLCLVFSLPQLPVLMIFFIISAVYMLPQTHCVKTKIHKTGSQVVNQRIRAYVWYLGSR